MSRIGSLLSLEGKHSTFSQLIIHDTERAVENILKIENAANGEKLSSTKI